MLLPATLAEAPCTQRCLCSATSGPAAPPPSARRPRASHGPPCQPAPGRRRPASACRAAPEAELLREEDVALPQARDDDVLPDSLSDALQSASEATQAALQAGCSRALVEVILPDLFDPNSGALFAEEGDQQRFWKLVRRFLEGLTQSHPGRVKALFPDTGAAAMLRSQWPDAPFRLGALKDRSAVEPEDDVVVFCAPDPQGTQTCVALAEEHAAQCSFVLFNPRLASGDVGVGLNVRRMRAQFLSTFAPAYCLRPIGEEGTVFFRHPGPWQVFLADREAAGRYALAATLDQRPDGEDLERLIQQWFARAGGDPERGEAGPNALQSAFTSLNRFMKALQR